MPHCSVCQAKYDEGQVEDCPVCGWNIQPYSMMVSFVPEVSDKEKHRLEWAKSMWAKITAQRDLSQQLQMQLKEAMHTIDHLKDRLESSTDEQLQLTQMLQAKDTLVSHLKTHIDQLQQNVQVYASFSTAIEPESSEGAIASPLQILQFEVVRVDATGQISHRYLSQASSLRETLNSASLEMIALPGGLFHMGSPPSEADRDTHEEPLHPVIIRPFYLSRFTITQAQWRSVAALPQIRRSLNPDPSHFKGDQLPVEQISWHEAIEFCDRLSHLTGKPYRLPSEAEWEYACRAGTTTPFHCGETLNSDLANYDGNDTYGEGAIGQYRQTTVPVGSLHSANAFGLCDLHGNVWEWCADSWHENYQDAPTDGEAWNASETGNQRVLRGGAWYCLPELCRSAQRHWDEANHSGSGIGFRVAYSTQ